MFVKYTKEDLDKLSEFLADYLKKCKKAETQEEVLLQNHELEKLAKAFSAQVERREFSKLGGDRDKIIKSAKEQIDFLINNHYDIISDNLRHNADPKQVASSFPEIRLDGDKFYLDTDYLVEACKKDVLILHYESLSADQDAIDQLDNLVYTTIAENPKTSSNKGKLLASKRKARSKKINPIYSESDQDFFMFPTTQANDLLYSIFSHDKDVQKIANNYKSISKRNSAEATIREKGHSITIESENVLTIIEILKSAYENTNSRSVKKLLVFIESEAYKKIFRNGKMQAFSISFPLQKLVDKGLYKSVISARKACKDAIKTITAIRIYSSVKSGKKVYSTTDGATGIMMFPAMDVSDNQCTVDFSHRINWEPILKDFFFLPDSWWILSSNASDLLYNIFRLIRLNKNKMRDGKLIFNVNLKTVATWLDLPLNTKNPKRDVKDPIEMSVKEILNSLNQNEFKIKIVTNLDAPLGQYLTGYLEITTGGIYTQNLLDLSQKQQKRIESAAQRKQEIIKEASIRKQFEEMNQK